MKKIHKNIILTLAIIFVGYSGYIAYCVHSFKQSRKSTVSKMNSSPFSCPDGSKPIIDGWGFNGSSRYCVSNSQKDGPWEAWEGEYLHIKGNYQRGLEHGEWVWFDKSGSRFRTVLYSQGKELSNVVIDNKK